MHPILFKIPLGWLPYFGAKIGELPIYSYGVMLGLSIVIGWYVSLGIAEKDGLPREDIGNGYVLGALGAMVGARLLYVLTNLDEFHSFGDMLAIRRGGLVAYGGFLGGFFSAWGFAKYKKLPVMPWADAVAPALGTGLMLTRIGCYLFGCDFGKPLSAKAPAFLKKLGTFPHWPAHISNGHGSPAWIDHANKGLIDAGASASLPVHPTQLYESLVGLFLFSMLVLQRKKQKFRGQVFLLCVFLYAIFRYLLEIIRGDGERGQYGPVMDPHFIYPLGLLIFGFVFTVTISKVIEKDVVRKVMQALSFAPAIALFIVMRPDGSEVSPIVGVMFSTSQWLALFTGVAAAVTYNLLLDAAKKRPKAAMHIDLREYREIWGAEEDDDEDEDEDGDDAEDLDTADDESDEDSEPKKSKAKRRRRKKKKKRPVKESTAYSHDDDADEDDGADSDDSAEQSDEEESDEDGSDETKADDEEGKTKKKPKKS